MAIELKEFKGKKRSELLPLDYVIVKVFFPSESTLTARLAG